MKKIISFLTPIQWLAVLLMIIGVAIMIPKARGMMEFYKEANYAAQNNFSAGNLSPDLIRPWMSIRYISVAYAVPQSYMFEALNVTPRKETSMIAVSRLNKQEKHGKNADGNPVIMKTVQDAILAYRANPVVTGLIEQHVEDWMTIQYIANSTGIPAEAIFAEINLPADGNANKPLGFLSDETNYSGGSRAMIAAIQKIVDEKGKKPDLP